MENTEAFDFEAFKKEAIAGMYAGKPLNGEKGINDYRMGLPLC